MSISIEKVGKLVDAGLRLLTREIVLPNLVWRDAAGDFAGVLNDTISIRVPAYSQAKTRDLRSGTTRDRDNLNERKVDVTLDTDVYKDLRITDEELSLDIFDFAGQVMQPAMQGIALELEQKVIDEMSSATYANTIAFNLSTGDAWKDIIVKSRRMLNDARVPMSGRVLAVGSAVEEALLNTDLFVKANESGTTSAQTDATIGQKAGFNIVAVPGLNPDEAYAFHRTAYVMSNRAPKVPAGAPSGASSSFNGLSMRAVQILDSATIEDILALDSWVGTNHVTDDGAFDTNGLWVPSEAAVRTLPATTASATTDTFASTSHGLSAGDEVVFENMTGGAGLTAGRRYYVISSGLTGSAFKVSTTSGGSAVDITTDLTAANAYAGGASQFVRAVKITAS